MNGKPLYKNTCMMAWMVSIAMAICCSCTRRIYIPVENTAIRTDTLLKVLWHTDTIIDRDTVLTLIQGDSVTTETIRWRWRVKETHDTLLQCKTDSVYINKPYPVEIIKEVEKPLQWWQKVLIWSGGITLLCLALSAWRKTSH